jgi:Uma2 family endonuclease
VGRYIYKTSPAPSSMHQKVSMRLTLEIGNFLKSKKCQLFSAPFDVRLPLSSKQRSDKEIITVVQPDLCVVCDPSKIDERGCLGAPDWIIEILSMYTSAKDLREKLMCTKKPESKNIGWCTRKSKPYLSMFLMKMANTKAY